VFVRLIIPTAESTFLYLSFCSSRFPRTDLAEMQESQMHLSRYLVVVAALSLASSVHLSAQPGLRRSCVVGYGVNHLDFTLPGPFTLDVLETALPNTYVRFESFRPNGIVKTSEQEAANGSAGHRVVGASFGCET